jgi:hypothetical protein
MNVPFSVTRQYIIGALLGLTLAFPLLGRISHMPASVVGLIFPLLAIIIAAPRLSRLTIPFAGALTLFASLVFQAAEPSQIEFISSPANWMNHSARYYESKLLMFLVAYAPVAIAAVAASLGNDRRGARLNGFLYSLLAVALLGFARTIPYLHLQIRTDWITALPFYDADQMGFSIVSLGILFLFGALTSLALFRSWMLPAAFAIVCFLFDRKTEFVLISASLTAMILWRLDWRQTAARQIILSAVTIAVAIILLHNEINMINWRMLAKTTPARVEVISEAVSENKATVLTGEVASSKTIASQVSDEANKETAKLASAKHSKIYEVVFGKGLGWYATLGGSFLYPHNSLIESYLETGLPSACLLAAVILFAAVMCLRRATFKHDAKYFSLFLMIVGFFVVCMKAGELTLASRLFGLSLIATAFACGVYGAGDPRSASIGKDTHWENGS